MRWILLVYAIIGIVLTTIVDKFERNEGRSLPGLGIFLSIIGWPYFFGSLIVWNIKGDKNEQN